MREAPTHFFPLPNDIFMLELSPGEIAVYAYLLYREDRVTYRNLYGIHQQHLHKKPISIYKKNIRIKWFVHLRYRPKKDQCFFISTGLFLVIVIRIIFLTEILTEIIQKNRSR